MSYAVKEIYYTLQGEGVQAGRPAVFCRFAGCNLWSGREEDRGSATCRFCDTDFVGLDGPGGGRFLSARTLARAIREAWVPESTVAPLVVCTGGEPGLQLDDGLIEALHAEGMTIAVESNGTVPLPTGLDWVCVSPKAGTTLVVQSGDELKLVYPQPGLDPVSLEHLDFHHRLLQPMDGPQVREHTRSAVAYCLAHPQWRLSLQMHKMLNIP